MAHSGYNPLHKLNVQSLEAATSKVFFGQAPVPTALVCFALVLGVCVSLCFCGLDVFAR